MRTIHHIRFGPDQQVTDINQLSSAPDEHYWIDLIKPERDEVLEVEKMLGIELPTAYEMAEIETSSRLYSENGALYLTASLVAQADTEAVQSAPVTFVLFRRCLITIRYIDNTPFRNFFKTLNKPQCQVATNVDALSGLLDAIVDRLADILEKISADLEVLANDIFASGEKSRRHVDNDQMLKEILKKIGRDHGLNSKARESIVSLNRLLVYLIESQRGASEGSTVVVHLKGIARDLQSLGDHSSFISSKITFLQDATLGLINIEQNQIIKIFSIAAVIFLPPTLVASIYGMNVDHIPGLHSDYAFVITFVLMVLSAVIPYWYFHRKGWI